MEMLNKEEHLAQIYDLRRRLQERDFKDLSDGDDAEIIDIAEHREGGEQPKYDSEHPTMHRRTEPNG